MAAYWQDEHERQLLNLEEEKRELRTLIYDLWTQAKTHHDPLSSEGSEIDHYEISVELYNRIREVV